LTPGPKAKDSTGKWALATFLGTGAVAGLAITGALGMLTPHAPPPQAQPPLSPAATNPTPAPVGNEFQAAY
jgi:hypothetical protein